MLGADVEVLCAERDDGGWVIQAVSISKPVCPRCGTVSRARHSSYIRRLRDLPVQGEPATVKLRVGRWRCRNEQCDRRIFAAGAGVLAVPSAQRTQRAAEIVRLFGHAAGGRPAERLLAHLGMPTSDDTILRHVKRDATARAACDRDRRVGMAEGPDIRHDHRRSAGARSRRRAARSILGGHCRLVAPSSECRDHQPGPSGSLCRRRAAGCAASTPSRRPLPLGAELPRGCRAAAVPTGTAASGRNATPYRAAGPTGFRRAGRVPARVSLPIGSSVASRSGRHCPAGDAAVDVHAGPRSLRGWSQCKSDRR